MRESAIVVLLFCFSLLFCGCDLWMDGNYYSYEPHLEENAPLDQESIEVLSYNGLRDALVELVEDGTQKTVIYISGFTPDQLESYMSRAVKNVTQLNAVGAYAVESISYEIGTTGGKPAIAVEIAYVHSRSEILRIKQTKTMEEAVNVITAALDNCDAGVVLKVDAYDPVDFTQLVQDYMDTNPHSCMEMPQVTATLYPEKGAQRVIEISFTYQTSRDVLRSMQKTVEPIFDSARLYVSTDAEDWQKYSLLYAFLMERYDYKEEISITPTYSLLRHGVGDSKAFAVVYAAMCRQAGLNCQVVSGTKAGEAWCWNILQVEGVYYHVDLLQCSRSGGFSAKLDDQMSGYVWDYSAYMKEPVTTE